jgi:flagellar P-ring protein FlgI
MKTKNTYSKAIKAVIVCLLLTPMMLQSARIKDIATIEGVTGVQVIGYGLVTGLGNKGDNQRASFTVQSVTNMLKRFGVTVPETNPRMRNVAAVMVTATIPTFLRPGSKVDVQVSSIGDAQSLQGGILLMTPLSRSTGEYVGMAQGAVSVGGWDFQSLGSRAGRNFVNTGRVPNGLILEMAIGGEYLDQQILRIVLRDPDFTTANNVAQAINQQGELGANAAVAIDAATIQVQMPGTDPAQNMPLISTIESLNIVSDPVARVVINERTGTIVIGGNVQLLPAVISHGGLEISIQKQVIIPQPAPFTIRPPQIAETAEITTQEEVSPTNSINIPEGATVEDMAAALNELKVSPRDLIAIFQALKESGSLQGELIIQ